MERWKKLYRGVFLASLSLTALPAKANVIQFFFGNNYKNPAELSMIPHAEAMVGVTGVNPVMEFKGVSGGGSGTASSNETDFLPYFYGGIRLSPEWVVGLNISQPIHGSIRYPEDSILRFDSTQTLSRDVDINPQLSYQVSKNLALGAGYNYNIYYDNEYNFVAPGFGNITNEGSAVYQGAWDVGLLYTLTRQDFISLAYFSPLQSTLTGKSTSATGVENAHYQLEGFNLPATSVFNYVHIFNPQWLVSLKVFYSQWDTLKNAVPRNVVPYGTISLPVHYRNTFAGELGARYAFAPDWAVLGGVGFDQGPPNDFTRTISFPADDAYAVALGLEHQFCKALSSRLTYTYVTANTHVNHPLGLSQSVGDIDIYANVVDLSLTYKI